MDFEKGLGRTEQPETNSVIDYYRGLFDGDEVVRGSVIEMEIGESGYTAYWAVDVDSRGRYWLSPLFKVSDEQSDTSILITREADGYIADFSYRHVRGRDRFYDSVECAEDYDRGVQEERFRGIPVKEVVGQAYKLPGYYCDENGQPPSPGENGELYEPFD